MIITGIIAILAVLLVTKSAAASIVVGVVVLLFIGLEAFLAAFLEWWFGNDDW